MGLISFSKYSTVIVWLELSPTLSLDAMGKNNIGLDYKYYKIRDVMREMGREALCQGVSTRQILFALKSQYPNLWLGAHELAYVRSTLRVLKVGQPKFPRSRTPELFVSLGNGLWTLSEVDATPENKEKQVCNVDTQFTLPEAEPDEVTTLGLKKAAVEGGVAYKLHRARDRSKMAQQFKKQLSSFCCEACGFDFGKTYGTLGKGFIEAHHVVPLHEGERLIQLEDFRAVCSNCHSMLHLEGARTVEDLRELIRPGPRRRSNLSARLRMR